MVGHVGPGSWPLLVVADRSSVRNPPARAASLPGGEGRDGLFDGRHLRPPLGDTLALLQRKMPDWRERKRGRERRFA